MPDAVRWQPASAAAMVGPRNAAAMLEVQDLVLRFPRPRSFDDGPTLAGRVRGALGAALAGLRDDPPPALRRRRDLCSLPPAWEVLFGDPLPAPPRLGALPQAPARPFAIFCSSRNGEVEVTVRLIGRGRFWLPELALAAEVACRGLGIAIAPLARSRAKLPDGVGMIETRVPARAPPPDPKRRRFRLLLESPTRLASEKHLRATGETLAASIVSRATGALAWCGWQLDLSPDAFEAAAKRLEIHETDLSAVVQEGRSGRQNKSLMSVGLRGAATLSHVDPTLSSLFPLVELVGMGMGTVKGMGRCRFLEFP